MSEPTSMALAEMDLPNKTPTIQTTTTGIGDQMLSSTQETPYNTTSKPHKKPPETEIVTEIDESSEPAALTEQDEEL